MCISNKVFNLMASNIFFCQAAFSTLKDVGDTWRSVVNAHVVTRKLGAVVMLTMCSLWDHSDAGRQVPDFATIHQYYQGQVALYGEQEDPSRLDCALLAVCNSSKQSEVRRVGTGLMKTLGLTEPIHYRCATQIYANSIATCTI